MYTIIYLYLSFIYIGASLYSSSFLSFFLPFVTFQRKMKEKGGWLFPKIIERVADICIFKKLLFKMGNVKKDGHTGGVREMSICNIATATVNI